ncbi:DUF2255 family protein [Luteococcus peritonei]|uniref:DUF2255 family protein n=1 Tax=Luteococcus peritonei TaxID=88874 RepID=A0ABW4RSL9_9ACTN
MSSWPRETIEAIAASDDLHICAHHPDGSTGTLTWIWSVVVDGRLFVRSYSGTGGRWYGSALAQRTGVITAAGGRHEVAFTPVSEEALNDRIDEAYRAKYATSAYLGSMIGQRARAATMELTPRP